jgi:DNA-binding transcriptional MocR family regulator
MKHGELLMIDLPNILQLQLAPGVIDLAWGHPDMTLLPVHAIRQASDRALNKYAGAMLTYGIDRGVKPLRDAVQRWLAMHEGTAPNDNELMISAGNSHALALVGAMYAQPGDIVFVENPTYHLALRILRDMPIDIRPISCDEEGMIIDELAAQVAACHAANQRIAFIYMIPTCQNPTGVTLSAERREALKQLVESHALLVVEDDVYRELWYNTPPLPSLWQTIARGHVIRLGSFAKSLAPGLRIGYITASAPIIDRLSGCGLLDSGGGMAHYPGLMVAELMESGDYAAIVSGYRTAYARRRDALHHALLPLQQYGYQWQLPTGGYFLWMRLPQGTTATDALVKIRAVQVDALPGTLFSQLPLEYQAVRFAFSLFDEAQLTDAGQRIVRSLT